VDGLQIPYIIAGNGGYGVLRARGNNPVTPMKVPIENDDVVLNTYDDQNLGFLRVTVDSSEMRIEYQPVSADTPADSVTVSLKEHQVRSTPQ
jgi:hypothetical protein